MKINRLVFGVWLLGAMGTIAAPAALAEANPISRVHSKQVITHTLNLSAVEQPLATAEGLPEQQAVPTSAPAEVTDVQLKSTDKGLEVILETTDSVEEGLTSSSENSLITDIPNAQLRLPEGGAFRQDNPTQAIALVEVTNLDAETLRVTVTGTAGVPTAEVSQDPQALTLSVAAPSVPSTEPSSEPPPEQQAPTGASPSDSAGDSGADVSGGGPSQEAPQPSPQDEEKPDNNSGTSQTKSSEPSSPTNSKSPTNPESTSPLPKGKTLDASLGEIYHNVPSDMQAGVKEVIEAGTAPKITQQIKDHIEGKGEVKIKPAGRFDPAEVNMKLNVDPSEFKVLERRGGEQFVTSKMPGKWVWFVTPLQDGDKDISVVATVDGLQSHPIQVDIFSNTTKVKANWRYSFREFVSENWKWGIALLFGSGSLASVFRWWIGNRKKSNTA